LQQREDAVTLRRIVVSAFQDPDVAELYIKQVQERVEKTLPLFSDDQEEDTCVLPPLFLRSEADIFAELTPTLFLVAFESGPIFPVVRIPLDSGVAGDQAFEENIFEIYEAFSEHKIGPSMSFDDLFAMLRARDASPSATTTANKESSKHNNTTVSPTPPPQLYFPEQQQPAAVPKVRFDTTQNVLYE